MKAISKLMGKSSEEKVESHYSTTDSMKAVVWEKGKMSVKSVPRPLLLRDEDVIVRVTMCGVSSGEDKKLTSGEAPSVETLSEGAQMSGPQNIIVGHECVGIVADKGPAVKNLSIGQRVAVAYDYACGQCPECENGHHSCCELMNAMEREAEAAGKAFHPSTNLGGHCKLPGYTDGSHAEYVRVPFGDVNCFPVPDKVSDEKALLLSGVLCTALHAVELGEVSENTTVAIWGLGPIGMCAARWCQIRGARRVVGIDTVSERLGLAFAKLGIDAVNRKDADKGSLAIKLHQMEPKGFDVCIDAIGYQPNPSTMEKVIHTLSMSSENLPRNPTDVLDECIESVKPFGRVVVIGDYAGQSHTFPIGKIMSKSVTLKSGRCPCQKYFHYITKSLQDGTIDPSFLITHRVTLDEIPNVFDNITSKKDEGFVKIVATVGDDYSKTEPRESRHLGTESKHLGTETRQMGTDTQHLGADTKHLGTEPRHMAADPRHIAAEPRHAE